MSAERNDGTRQGETPANGESVTSGIDGGEAAPDGRSPGVALQITQIKGKFHLFRYFSLSSAAVLVAVVLLLATLYRQTAENELIDMTETQNLVLAHSLADSIWPRFAGYLEVAPRIDPAKLALRAEPAEIHRIMARLTAGLPVLKVKTYTSDGLTVYSSDFRQIGESKADNPAFIRSARDGIATSKLGRRDEFRAYAGTLHDVDVIETYLPIVGAHGTVRGIFEIYTDVTPLMTDIRETTDRLMVGLFAAFGMLYAGLLLIVRRADRILRRQYATLEKQVKRREKVEADLHDAMVAAKKASRAKSSFLTNMSHELRTPLNAVIGFSDVIASETFGPVDPPKYRDYAADIQRAGRHLLSLVDNVLDLAEIEAGRMDVDRQVLDVGELVTEIVTTLGPVVARNDNELRLDCEPGLGLIATDEAKLRSILVNLLGNAAKFTRQGRITLAVSRDDCWFTFTVGDTGVGIEPEKLDRLFEEFSQADGPATTRNYGGTGLGLAISKRFCEILGGAIAIDSRPGAGTTVTVRLPARAMPHAQELRAAG